MPKHVDGAAPVDFGGQPPDELGLGARQTAVELLEPVPCLGLSGTNEREEILGVDPRDRLERRRPGLSGALHLVVAAVLDQPRGHVLLERRLVRLHFEAAYC